MLAVNFSEFYMKDISKRVPFERVIFLQRMICTVLIALMLLFSFGGFFSVPFDDDFTEFYAVVGGEEQEDYISDTVFVKVDFLGSALSLFKMLELSGSNASAYYNAYHDVIDFGEDHPLSLRGTAFAYLIIEAYDNDFTVGIYFTLMLLTTLAFPVLFSLSLLFTAKESLFPTEKANDYSIFRGVMRRFRRILCLVPFPIMLTSIATKVELGFSSIAIFALAGLGILANAVAPRFKNYTKVQKKYITMIQCVSVLGVIIFAIFCNTLISSNTIHKAIGLFDNKSLSQFFALFKGGNFDINKIIAIIAGILFFAGLLGIHHSLANNLCRLGFTTTRMKKRDYSRGDEYIKTTIRPNLMIIVYILLLGSQDELIFYGEERLAFFICMLCVALMTLTEIAVLVLGETVCSDLGKGGKDIVLEGTIYEAQIEKYTSKGTKSKGFSIKDLFKRNTNINKN